MKSLHCACIAIVTIGLAAPSLADVLVVRPNGTYPEIQAAVHAASNGDTILVRTGDYAGVVIGDKALTIVADDGATVTVTGGIQVNGPAVSRDVVLSGLDVRSDTSVGSAGLAVTSSAGSVRVQGCTLRGMAQSVLPGDGNEGLSIEASSDVALAACTITGATPLHQGGNGGRGMRVRTSSSVAGYALQVLGGSASTSRPGGCAGIGGNGTSLSGRLVRVLRRAVVERWQRRSGLAGR